jgi:hypothetical protein
VTEGFHNYWQTLVVVDVSEETIILIVISYMKLSLFILIIVINFYSKYSYYLFSRWRNKEKEKVRLP